MFLATYLFLSFCRKIKRGQDELYFVLSLSFSLVFLETQPLRFISIFYIFSYNEMASKDRLTVAVLGLGAMGSAIAENIFKNGYKLVVWNRTQSKTKVSSFVFC